MRIVVLLFVALLAGCATSPEAQLKRGYQFVSVSAQTTTALLDRHAIGSKQAEGVLAVAGPAKAMLDAGKAELKQCREAQAAGQQMECTGAKATIQLGAGLLLELERYLETMEAAK